VIDKARRKLIARLGAAILFGLGSAPALDALLGRAVRASTPKGPGNGGIRRGMVINLAKCTEGCTKCLEACHTEHNVPAFDNPKDEIKWIWKDGYHNVFPGQAHALAPQSIQGRDIPTLCNHCENPPCVRVCPTKATFKRPDGIVAMDFHRCIGCRFCMAGCPYGSRSFNWRDPRPFIKTVNKHYPTREKGVVEKCSFCASRVDRGLGPACVEACVSGALVFGNLNDPSSEIRRVMADNLTMQRKPELGTNPSVYYIFQGGDV